MHSIDHVLMPNPQGKLAAAKSNGDLTAFAVNPDSGKLEILKEWKESRHKPVHKFVGLGISSRYVPIFCSLAH